MPIFAPYPLVDTPTELPPVVVTQPVSTDDGPSFDETRGFAFRSIDGKRTLEFTGREFIARWGIQGLDVPARTVVEENLATQDGSDLSDIKIGSRQWAMPIFIGSDTGHRDYLSKRAQMRAFFNHRNVDYRTLGGTFDLVAVSTLGERTLRSTYVSGMDGSWDVDTSGSFWETFGLQAISVNPYWHGGRWTTEMIRPVVTTTGFFGRFPPSIAPRNLVNGTSAIYVDGDAASWPRIEAVGPCTYLSVIDPNGDLDVEVPDGLDDGETLLIDTDPRHQTANFGGVSDWSRVSPLSVQAPLDVGDQQLLITMFDTGANSSAWVSGETLFETPW